MNILVLTSDTPGLATTDLVRYLMSPAQDIEYHYWGVITHPVSPLQVEGQRSSTFNEPDRDLGRRSERIFSRGKGHGGLPGYLKDLWLTYRNVKDGYDWAICAGPHLAFIGLMLKRKKVVSRVAYWALDYYPKRYGSGGVVRAKGVRGLLLELLEKVYRRLEKYVVSRVDVRWIAASGMEKAWRKDGYSWSGPVRTVPHCISEVLRPVSVQRREKAAIWSGSTRDGFGFDKVVEAWLEVERRLPGSSLTVTSRSPVPKKYEEFLKRPSVHYLGFIEDEELFKEIVSSHYVGLSPYDPESFKHYSDPARVKTYISCGVPVIISPIPPNWQEIEEANAGLVSGPGGLADALVRLLSDPGLVELLSEGAHRLAYKYLAAPIFERELLFLEKVHNESFVRLPR